jgi:hypothetical protein
VSVTFDMYVYLHDNFLYQRKFSSVLKSLDIRLTDYGIAGKVLRIGNYADARPLLEEEVRRGAKTAVIVGNDTTLGSVLSRCADLPLVFGFLPIGPQNSIAEVLGIPIGLEACKVVARRRREKLDVGLMNSRYFIAQVHILPAPVAVMYDGKFTVEAKELMEVVVCNLQPFIPSGKNALEVPKIRIHPQDGKLEGYLRPLTKKRWWGYNFEEPSVFPFVEMRIKAVKPFKVITDGRETKELDVTISMAMEKIDMIVGKSRKF